MEIVENKTKGQRKIQQNEKYLQLIWLIFGLLMFLFYMNIFRYWYKIHNFYNALDNEKSTINNLSDTSNLNIIIQLIQCLFYSCFD